MHRPFHESLLLLALALSACATTPSAPPEMLLVEADVRAGTVLSGPLAERAPDELDWADAWMLETRIAYVDRVPEGGTPLAGRVVVVDGASRVFGTTAQLAANVRVAPGEVEGGEVLWEERALEAVPAGATVALRAELGRDIPGAASADWNRWALEVSRGLDDPDRIEAALVFEGSITPRLDPYEEEGEEGSTKPPPAPIDVRERVVLDTPLVVDGGTLRFVLPVPGRRAPNAGFLVEARLARHAGESDDFAEAVARGRRLAEAAHARVLAEAQELGESEGFRFESGNALRALNGGELQRPALVFLAQSTGAAVTEELALVAAPETLGEFLADVARRTGALEHPPEGAQAFGWFLERCAYLWLCDRAEDEKRALEPELSAVLQRHAGEVSGYRDLVREAVSTSADPEALLATLVRVNRIFLEDAHPAARVRAYDWLVANDVALAEFDPLGPLDERRDVLARLEAAAEAVPAGAPADDAGGDR